jgi:hypothetical protein
MSARLLQHTLLQNSGMRTYPALSSLLVDAVQPIKQHACPLPTALNTPSKL